jgi:uncharacterized membrane protein YdjX (TVP38/TMEM64 family)
MRRRCISIPWISSKNNLETAPAPNRRWLPIIRIATFLFVIGILVVIFALRDQVKNLYQYGYVGVFLVTLIANATVFIPVPGVMVVFAMGAVFQPFITAVVAGLGAATGELSGYLLGFSGQGLAERSPRYDRLYTWMEQHKQLSGLAILALAAIPNPFFDMAGIAAGALKMPVLYFWLYCAAGSVLKMLFFAYFGSTTLRYFFK